MTSRTVGPREAGPGAVVGILGGGQLGRMLALAAARLGVVTHVYSPEAGGPGTQVAARETVALYDDSGALDRFAERVDVVTYEFENVPLAAVRRLAERVPVHPGPEALATTQDRLAEKRFAAELGIETAPFRAVDDASGLAGAFAEIGAPAVLKTRRLGYDGKGQVRLASAADVEVAATALAGAPAILEGFVAFEREISVIAARGRDGAVACYEAVENRHRDHILRTSIAPAAISAETAARAREIAIRLLEGLNYVGVMGIELFHLPSGALLLNEIAPRVHNSGHWTIEGAVTSQFEQHIRAILGLPLGDTTSLGEVVMTNLIGDEVNGWRELLADPENHLHLYGKEDVREGRKMGHVTRIRRR